MTLTQAANITRRGILISISLIILGAAGAIGYNIWHQRYLDSLPPVEEKPEMKFGTLPKLIFPSSNVSSSNYSYTLDTVTGGLPQTPKLLKVYFIPQSGISLLAPERSRNLAENFGFSIGPEVLSSTRYKFADDSGGQLLIDLTNGNFNFQRNSLLKNLIENGSEKNSTSSANLNDFSSKEKIAADFKKFLLSKNLLTQELSSGRSNVLFDNGSNKESATVSIWPTDFDNLPIITSSFNQSLIRAKVNNKEEENDKYSEVNYTFWIIDKTTYSTYPLKTAEQAFSDLKAGLGFVSLEPKKPQVSISSVYLAYFESEEYSPYLQPIFIFEGPEFAAIVPAIAQGTQEVTPTQN